MGNYISEHIVLYMQAKYLLRWKRIVLNQMTPLFIYGSKAQGFGKWIKDNYTTLWVVSPIAKDRRPALVARMKVKKLA